MTPESKKTLIGYLETYKEELELNSEHTAINILISSVEQDHFDENLFLFLTNYASDLREEFEQLKNGILNSSHRSFLSQRYDWTQEMISLVQGFKRKKEYVIHSEKGETEEDVRTAAAQKEGTPKNQIIVKLTDSSEMPGSFLGMLQYSDENIRSNKEIFPINRWRIIVLEKDL